MATLVQSKSPPARLARRAIVRRSRGVTHGPITRLMGPSDFGGILKSWAERRINTNDARVLPSSIR
jgi:hypothetical protein